MRRVLCVVLAMGLGTLSVGGCPPVEGRLDVTDDLRQACSGFATDPQIEVLITETETDRINGWTKQEVFASTEMICYAYTSDVALACMTCGSAVLDQVFGE